MAGSMNGPMESALIRQLQALLDAQTNLRRTAEGQAQEARKALERVAEGLCAEELDTLEQQSPSGLSTLDANQICTLILRTVRRRLGKLEAVAGTIDVDEVLALREEVERLRAAQARAETALASPSRPTSQTKAVPADRSAATSSAESAPRPSVPLAPDRGAPPWQPPVSSPPAEPTTPLDVWPEWAREWRKKSGNYDRDAEVVLVLGDTGMARREDVDQVLAAWWSVTPGSGSIGRAITRAREAGLVEAVVAQREKGRYPRHLLRLTERGRDAYRLLRGEEPALSQTTELLKRHKSAEHAALNLDAAILLWQAGYTVDLFPDKVDLEIGTYYPDLVADLDELTLYIECERDTHKNPEERDRKWELYYQATGGHFAVVTPTKEDGCKIQAEIEAWAGERPLTLWMASIEDREGKMEWLEVYDGGQDVQADSRS